MRLGRRDRTCRATRRRRASTDASIDESFDLRHLAIGLDLQPYAEPVVVAAFTDAAEKADLSRLFIDEVEPIRGGGRSGLPQTIAHREANTVLGVFHAAGGRKARWIVLHKRVHVSVEHAGETVAIVCAIRVGRLGCAGPQHQNDCKAGDILLHEPPVDPRRRRMFARPGGAGQLNVVFSPLWSDRRLGYFFGGFRGGPEGRIRCVPAALRCWLRADPAAP